MNGIVQAFGDLTLAQILIFVAGVFGLFELGKRLYMVLSKFWEERRQHFKVKTTLDDVLDELLIIKKELNIIENYQIFHSSQEFKRLYFKAKKQYEQDGFVLMDTYEEIYQTYDAYKALGGNGNKSLSMMDEIDRLPKQSIYSKVAKERKEENDI